jgi:Flp pilus assembly protein TadD
MPADRMIMGRNAATSLLSIASHIVAGELAAKQGKPDEAVTHLEEAVKIQDGLAYNEPPPWYYPVRQSLGAVLVTAGKNVEAEQVYRKDLALNPNNGWSLYGLAQSLRAQGKSQDAAAVEEQFKKPGQRLM